MAFTGEKLELLPSTFKISKFDWDAVPRLEINWDGYSGDDIQFTISATKQTCLSTNENDAIDVSIINTNEVSRFHVVVNGYPSEDADYGAVDSIIERPDYLIKHFLVEVLGFDSTDIDDESFNTAGALYSAAVSGGYKFGFAILQKITPSEWLKRLAFECRSNLRYRSGKWYLDYIPDWAPTVIKTIAKEELAGEMSKFSFYKMPWINLANDIEAKYKHHYSTLDGEGEWGGTVEAEDSASQSKYGTYPLKLQFEAIRGEETAADIVNHILLQRKVPLLSVLFPVYWEHFDLGIGDTFDIENPFYNGKKFYIENFNRLDKFRAQVEALEWW